MAFIAYVGSDLVDGKARRGKLAAGTFIRQLVTQAMGLSPSDAENRAANLDGDIDTSRASRCTDQSSPGPAWMAAMARPTTESLFPRNQPTSPLGTDPWRKSESVNCLPESGRSMSNSSVRLWCVKGSPNPDVDQMIVSVEAPVGGYVHRAQIADVAPDRGDANHFAAAGHESCAAIVVSIEPSFAGRDLPYLCRG